MGDALNGCPSPLTAARDRDLIRRPQAPEDVLREDHDHSLSSTSLAKDHSLTSGSFTGANDGAIANARKADGGVARVVIGMDEARARRRVVTHVAKDTVTEAKSEDHTTVTYRDVRIPVAVDSIRVVSDLTLVDVGEQIDAHEFLASHESSRCCTRLKKPRLAASSSTILNDDDGPDMIVDGPGPCPKSRQLPVEMTPMEVHPSRYPRPKR